MVFLLVAAVGYCGIGDEDSRTDPPMSETSPLVSSADVPDDESSSEAVIVFLTSRYQEAILAFENGSYEKSWKMCEAIIVLAPDPFPLLAEVRKLRRRAHGRHLARSVLVIRFSHDPADPA